ncbi:MAG: 2-dehydro-3-deoxygalactonokinase [Hyphomicrobiales bacterium]|nr:2-dehydro-3-deoxygalactonokinase [Hyphomicrobiales bacterium]MBV8663987.1 2-dehydro-3-deoxygalactonokinase [Hyphomicrobiales bacterium]
MPHSPALVSVDWGTSSFRAFLAASDGTALDEVGADRGALGLAKGEHETFLSAQIGAWKQRYPELPVVMSGMVGARQGWVEAPYAPCPAGAAEIAAAALTIPAAALGPILLAPGLSALDSRGAPDVMRGEETQILGALKASGGRDGLYVLPGTHSKWARVADGRILGFTTFMTGDVFAALKDHTVLGRLMGPAGPNEPAGFALGVDAAASLERPGDLLHAIFMTRTLGLFERLAPAELAEYLSGLLIGAEILAGAGGASSAIVVGSAALTARYRKAGALIGVELEPAPANCATLGQIALVEQLRLG